MYQFTKKSPQQVRTDLENRLKLKTIDKIQKLLGHTKKFTPERDFEQDPLVEFCLSEFPSCENGRIGLFFLNLKSTPRFSEMLANSSCCSDIEKGFQEALEVYPERVGKNQLPWLPACVFWIKDKAFVYAAHGNTSQNAMVLKVACGTRYLFELTAYLRAIHPGFTEP